MAPFSYGLISAVELCPRAVKPFGFCKPRRAATVGRTDKYLGGRVAGLPFGVGASPLLVEAKLLEKIAFAVRLQEVGKYQLAADGVI